MVNVFSVDNRLTLELFSYIASSIRKASLNTLKKGNYAVEHFIPYAFVSHDLIWNLIPADSSFNSIKSDKLPSLDLHFSRFSDLQRSTVEIIQVKSPKNKFLEDYLILFPDLSNKYFNREKFFEQFQPLITIKSNNGFEFL